MTLGKRGRPAGPSARATKRKFSGRPALQLPDRPSRPARGSYFHAHCSGTDGNTATNGCEAGTLPHGTPVDVDGATRPGTIVYPSWVAMQAARETDADACEYNDTR